MGPQQQSINGGDTAMTKVFVGGLAWETQKEALRDHFNQFGDIIEAVIIYDKLTTRSKGYGFVTFMEPEAARKACEDPSPVINGRRANCNLASLGARRPRHSPPPTPPPLAAAAHQPGMALAGPRGPPPAWYYHPSSAPPPPPYHHYHPGVVPYYPAAAAAGYGYSPSYVTDLAYTAPAKMGHPQGQFPYPSQAGMVAPNGMMPVYQMYPFHHHQSHSMGVPPHFFQSTTPTANGAMATMPTLISKPAPIPPTAVCLAVEQVTSCS